MNEKSDLEERSEIFTELCKKYPNYKPQIIKQVINKFNCDFKKIDEHLRRGSMGESPITSPNDSVRKDSGESERGQIYSFISMSSGNSGSLSPSPNSKTYRTSSELIKISSQKTDLQKLDEAFKRLEKHRDFLNRETLYFGEVIERRKTITDFPNINEIESLDKIVNKKYSMPAKSFSYANDLRQPLEMNDRFRGFRPPPSNSSCSKDLESLHSNKYLVRDQLNPNLFYSPQPIDSYLAPFRKVEEKRYSVHLDQTQDLSQEMVEHSQFRAGHHRQRSDPWLLDRVTLWDCPQCYTRNKNTLCSFCEYDPQNKN